MSKAADNHPNFDPSQIGQKNGGLFGFPYTEAEARVAVLGFPWDVTTSYGDGTSKGPEAIVEASSQLDFYHPDWPDFWKEGIYYEELHQGAHANRSMRQKVVALTNELAAGEPAPDQAWYTTLDADINAVFERAKEQFTIWIARGKLPLLVGGEHSTSVTLIEPLLLHHKSFGVLQIDAHADLRNAYMGIDRSHASVMHKVLQLDGIEQLTQVGVRDWCAEEQTVIDTDPRVRCFTQLELDESAFHGTPWADTCATIVAALPQRVYISFDVDGLQPFLCPNTGTPVPGGLSFEQAVYLIRTVWKSGRTIVGCDLVEVAPGSDEWDANVGARLVYIMALYMTASNR